ncbi:MAG: TIGR02270 family protein [Bryobacterales bacterium]|nr:TIGR02270 family protein [Bryobacterales bacterium]
MTPIRHAKPDLILWDVVEEHFEEAEFLFEQWEGALRSPKYNLTELGATLEQRLEAHLDALLVGGPSVAERVLDPELANADEPVRATVAALALLLNEEAESAGRVIDTALHTDGPLQVALARALALASVEPLDRMLLERFRASRTEPERAVLLGILTSRGMDVGDLLRRCFESDDQRLVGAALDSAGRFGRREIIAVAERHLRSDHPRLRASAIKASLALGSRVAWQLCRELAQDPNIDDPDLMLLIAILGPPADHQILYSRLENSASVERILWTLGFCGTAQAGNACLTRLESKDERVAKAAAEAMAWIGGFDFNDERFQESPPEPSEDETLPSLEGDDLDVDLDLDGFDDLPTPNRAAITQWWKENSDRLAATQRNLLGCSHSPGTVIHALDVGPLWRRHGVALELDIRSGGELHVSTDAFSSRQRRQIETLARMSAGQWSRVEP